MLCISCQSIQWERPNVPFCISNGDGSASCAFKDGTYIEENTSNWITSSPEYYDAYLDYVEDLEVRLQKACLAKRIYCDGLIR